MGTALVFGARARLSTLDVRRAAAKRRCISGLRENASGAERDQKSAEGGLESQHVAKT